MAVGWGQGGGLQAEVRKVKVIDSDRQEGHRFEERNFADIVYEYSVAGRKLRNNRVSIGEDLGNFQVAETIAKYPVGAIVTVYYNPLHPGEAVLERDLPKGMWGCLGIGTAIVLAIVFGSAIGLHQITEFVSTLTPQHGNPAAAVAFAAFGTVVALFALVLHRQASLAMKWPVVTGTISFPTLSNTARRRRMGIFAARPCTSAGCPIPTRTTISPTPMCTPASPAALRQHRVGWCASPQRPTRTAPRKIWVNPTTHRKRRWSREPDFVWVLWLVAAAIWGVAYYAAVHG